MAEENGNSGVEQDLKLDMNQKQNGNAGGGGGGGKKRGKDDVCRDFLNGICNRGSRCRFRHPEADHDPAAPNQSNIVPYTFCIDFQNKGCFRESCRFIHASSEDAERYQRKGIVSLPLARAIAATLTINDSINGIPICKEFQTGACSRGGNRCRYWHVNVDEERAARTNMLRMGGAPPGVPMGMPSFTPGMRRAAPLDYDSYDHIPAKRAYPGRMPPPHHMGMGMEPPPSAYVTSLERRNAELEKENEALRREVEREKSRYEDLMAVFKGQHHAAHPAPVPPPQMPQHPQYQQYPYHESHHPSWS